MTRKKYKLVLAPDSFKGSLTAGQVCAAMAVGIRRVLPDAEVLALPMADGGEGTVAALLESAGGSLIRTEVLGPLGGKISAVYGILDEDRTAVIEMAAASGLPLVPVGRRNPMMTTSYGTGQMIADALDRGCRRFIIGIGGSATSDCGSGMAQALGVRFLGVEDTALMNGEWIGRVTAIDLSGLHPALRESDITVACDVDNPLLGERGAVMVYARQKGAKEEQLPELERNIAHFASLLEKVTGRAVKDRPGAGAAGGLGAGLMAFTPARLERGVDLVMRTSHFEEKITGADLILTGEGHIDEQTLYGKTLWGVAQAAAKQNIPVVALTGMKDESAGASHIYGISAIFYLCEGAITVEFAMKNADSLITDTTERIIRLWRNQNLKT